jgi:hypothetical protein
METTGVALVDAGAIVVVATTREGTRAALAVAVPLARGTQSKLTLLVPRIVPNPADLDARADATPFFVDGYEAEIRHLGGRAMIVVCVCRTVDDLVDGLRSHRGSVIIGGPVGRWLTSPEERVASRRAGGLRLIRRKHDAAPNGRIDRDAHGRAGICCPGARAAGPGAGVVVRRLR